MSLNSLNWCKYRNLNYRIEKTNFKITNILLLINFISLYPIKKKTQDNLLNKFFMANNNLIKISLETTLAIVLKFKKKHR